MAYRPSIAVYDACVLYPFQLRNLLIQCAVDRLVEARWSDDIHDEWIRNLAARTSGLTADRLKRTRDLMKSVLPEADVQGHHRLIPDIRLPDPADRHVVAAAITGGATIIVTWNIKDFAVDELARHGLVCKDPDTFLTELLMAAPDATIASVANAKRNLQRTTPTVEEFLKALERQGLTRFTRRIHRHVAAL